MRYEIQKHWSKLKKVSKLTDKQLEESQFSLFNKLTFINEELIPKKDLDRIRNFIEPY